MLSELKQTHRGFRYYEFEDMSGRKCRLQESSLATEECIWLGVDTPKLKVLHGDAKRLGIKTDQDCGWVEYPLPKDVHCTTRMHLTQEQAGVLAKQLALFAETGELPAVPRD